MSETLCSDDRCSPPIPVVPSHWSLPAEPASVRCARRAVVGAFPRDCSAEMADELVLLVSELVTNAVRYGARRPVRMVLWFVDGYVWLAVSDHGSGRPRVGSPGRRDCGGRWLLLVDRVADVWAVVARPGCGKSVVVGMRRR
ncbi:ATP-binding protein [Embleya sp. NPDC055664]